MRKIIFLIMVLAFTPFAVSAEDKQDNRALCQFLPVKEYFVGADYVPGVDVNGNAVVPADVKTQAKGYVDVIRIPVTIDMAQNLGQKIPAETEMNTPVAMVEIYKDSRVIMNGLDVTEAAYTHCAKEPFNIEKAAVEEMLEPMMPILPESKPEQETIIWGEGY